MGLVEQREGTEAGRLDAFVDGAFAFILTLLLIGGASIPDSAAKLLHAARQPTLREELLRAVAEWVLGSRPIEREAWGRLKGRVEAQGFGRFRDGVFETYAPYLDRDTIVTYRPSREDFRSLEPLIRQRNDAEGMFYFAVAAETPGVPFRWM